MGIKRTEIRNEANISEKIREARLRWLGYVEKDGSRCSN